jgi:hypothetical protein
MKPVYPWTLRSALLLEQILPWFLAHKLDGRIDAALRETYEAHLATTRPFPVGQDDLHFELHMLLGRRHVGMGIWAIKSFLHFSGRRYAVVLHDDGSLGAPEIERLESHLPGVKIIARSLADSQTREMLAGYPNCSEFRFSVVEATNHRGQNYNMFIMALILFDMNLLTEADKIIILDADVLFFAPPTEITAWIADTTDRRSLYSIEKFRPYRDAKGTLQFALKPGQTLNSGLICFDRKRLIDLDKIETWIGDNKDLMYSDPVFEQLAYSYLIKRQPDSEALPGELYAFNFTNESVIATHFGMKRLFFENIARIEDALR